MIDEFHSDLVALAKRIVANSLFAMKDIGWVPEFNGGRTRGMPSPAIIDGMESTLLCLTMSNFRAHRVLREGPVVLITCI